MKTQLLVWTDLQALPVKMDLVDYLKRQSEFVLGWLDIRGRSVDKHRDIMENQVGLSKLAVDDALRERHPPKFESLSDGWKFLLLRGLDADAKDLHFGTIQLSLFWKDGLIVTRHDGASVSVNAITQRCLADDYHPESAPALVYHVVKALYARYFPIVLNLESRLEEIEDALISNPSDALLAELMEYSRQLKKLRRVANYHEATCRRLEATGEAITGVSAEQANDLHENSERFASLSNLQYEITTDLMNGYLSISSHRLNQVMRVLTVVTVIFVPLSFLAGLYGMNFEYIPELKWQGAYFMLLGLMVTIASALILVFRKRGWL